MSTDSTIILGIETSCDDTCVAVCQEGKILSNMISSQLQHDKHGGVVPEMASRLHLENMEHVFHTALKTAHIDSQDIDAIAYTQRPGLLGSLLVGAGFAKGLSLALGKPLIAIHHIQAHILSNFIDNPTLTYPFICLTASGGHTMLCLCESKDKIVEMGATRDDAAGETLDKIGKMLNLPFPAGKHIDELAKKGNPKKFVFPFVNLDNYDFSFSGLKTSVLYFLQNQLKTHANFIQENIHDICASVQDSVVHILIHKILQLQKQTGMKQVCISGGLAANSLLKKRMKEHAHLLGFTFSSPPLSYCTDNAAMIAFVGYLNYAQKTFSSITEDCQPS